MRIVVGLGNPGRKYAGTRHNIGFEIVNYIAGELLSPFKAGKGDYYFAENGIGIHKLLLVKPTTYVNQSGQAVRQIIDYFSAAVTDLLIICDDYNLPWGTFRFRKTGSDGGHNGLSSVIYELGTDVIDRFRFGIGDKFENAIDFVLSKFDRREQGEMNQLLPLAKEAVVCWIEQGIEATMNRYNRSFLTAAEENGVD